MRLLDLFAGIGGMSAGFDATGAFTTAAMCEIDQSLWPVLARTWPGASLYGDIRSLDPNEFAGHVDIVAGGVPCQPASLAGARRGDADERWLWPDFLRVVRGIRPRWVVCENVRGLLSTPSAATVWNDLEAQGYQVGTFVFGAWSLGAGHPRERVWIVAHADGFGLREWGRLPERQPSGRNAADGLGAEDVAHDSRLGFREGAGLRSDGEPRRRRQLVGLDPPVGHALGPRLEGLAGNDGAADRRPGPRGSACPPGVRGGVAIGPFAASVYEQQNEWEPERLIGGRQRAASRLNPAWCETYMGFRIGHTEGLEWKNRIKALGNAVCPPCSMAIAKAILRYERLTPRCLAPSR